MKLIIDSQKLVNALEVVKPVITLNTLIPVCDNVLFRVGHRETVMMATNTHHSIIHTVECDCEDEGTVLVPFHDLYALVKSFPLSDVTLKFESELLVVSCNKGVYNIPNTDKLEDFPRIETVKQPDHSVVISSGIIDELQKKSLKFVHSDYNMSTMYGVVFDFSKGSLNVVSMDMFCLSVFNIVCDSEGDNLFFAQKKAVELLSVFTHSEDVVTLKFDQRKFQAENENTVLITSLKDENFAKYKAMITDNPFYIEIDRKTMIQSLQRARQFTGLESIGLVIKNDEIEIIADNFFVNKGFTEKYPLITSVIDSDTHIGLNVKYLLNAFESVNSDIVRMSFKDVKSLVRVNDPEEKDTMIMMAQFSYNFI